MIFYVSSSDFRQKIVSRTSKISLKTILDTFFVYPDYYLDIQKTLELTFLIKNFIQEIQ
jgi:predicted glycosyltransferase involved in capsule biosynthesis